MKIATENALGKALAFLEQLETAKFWYRLEHVRDSLLVSITVPGERWEVEFFEDDHVEVERFVSSGSIEDERALSDLFTRHTDT
jgi:hypothetical protein